MPAYATGETVTVSGTAIGGTAATYLHATECFMVVQDQPIRWRADGTDPTSTVGFYAPAGQTTANYQFRHGVDGSSDEDPMTFSTLVASMTAAAHTVDLDGSVSATTSTPDAETATLWAVTMELTSASTVRSLMLLGVGQ